MTESVSIDIATDDNKETDEKDAKAPISSSHWYDTMKWLVKYPWGGRRSLAVIYHSPDFSSKDHERSSPRSVMKDPPCRLAVPSVPCSSLQIDWKIRMFQE